MEERAVGIIETTLRLHSLLSFEDNKEWIVQMMEYKNMRIAGLNISNYIVVDRRLKTEIPIYNKMLNAETFKNIEGRMTNKKEKQKHYYDRDTRVLILKHFNPGDTVSHSCQHLPLF